MSKNDTSVVICCAGMGTRLGIGTTKALMHMDGKPLIIHQLEALKEFDDVRVVVGYQAERVIEAVNEYRKDVMFVFNNDYKTTGPAASLSKGMIQAREYLLYIDGDILVNPDDFKRILAIDEEFIAVSRKCSSEPALICVEDEKAKCFSKDGNYEWTGITKVKAEKLAKGCSYTYEVIDKALPIPAVLIQSRDIDTPEDYENALKWANNGYID